MKLKLTVALAGAAVVWALAGATSAQAQDTDEYDPYSADPLGLIALYEVSSYYTSQIGVDRWDVWVCKMTGGNIDFSPEYYVEKFTAEISPFFEWLSQGKYRPLFTVGGTVTTLHPPSAEGRHDCQESVFTISKRLLNRSNDVANGALIIANSDAGEDVACGLASPGLIEEKSVFDPFENSHVRSVSVGGDGLFPDNGRLAFVYSTSPDYSCLSTSVIAHELGHTVSWPHSFSGQSKFNDDLIDEYDNWTDFMSGALSAEAFKGSVTYIGTSATNRYAAGWIDPSEVAIHTYTPDTIAYKLAASSAVHHDPDAIQMLVLPVVGSPGVFDVLSVRLRSGFDIGLPDEGVERYRIDQRPTVCNNAWPISNPTCHLADRRTIPVPYEHDERQVTINIDSGYISLHGSSAHMYQPGEWFETEGNTVAIEEDQNGIFTVTVTTECPYIETGVVGPGSWFCDDDGSVHESAIEALAEMGVTLACDTEGHQFCLKDPVTRAQMAAFLVRALESLPDSTLEPSSDTETFSDVADDAWYASYVDQLVGLGVTQGYVDGTYRPDVLVTRAQMATFFARAFEKVQSGDGDVPSFVDITAGSDHAAAIEGVLAAGITTGCSTEPLRYCPEQPITRDQMASFLARALNLVTT